MMCSIAGEVGIGRPLMDRIIQEEMLKTMSRRGPDDQGILMDEDVVLLHSRLAVVDIENGKQPMSCRYRNTDYTLVYNGELYNTEEIRNELKGEGESFIGHSDTEVLLKAFAHWGEGCVNKLNGIFAFAVWTHQKKKLFIARDRMGVKPFFYALPDGKFVFASEIKTLLKHPQIRPVIDRQGIGELFFIGPGRTPGCGVFRDILELRPGCCGTYGKNGLSVHSYWSLTDHPHEDDLPRTLKTVRNLVVDAIERQLVSDVPIGTFLSGGLDSSLISSVASRYFAKRGEKLQTFSVTYQDNARYFHQSKFQPDNDDVYIKKMVEYLGSEHYEYSIDTPQLTEALYAAVDARDLPGMADVDSSLLLFCREIRNHVTVALSGECADESAHRGYHTRAEEALFPDSLGYNTISKSYAEAPLNAPRALFV